MVFEIDRQTDRQTHKHAHRNVRGTYIWRKGKIAGVLIYTSVRQ